MPWQYDHRSKDEINQGAPETMRYLTPTIATIALLTGCAGEPPLPDGVSAANRGELVCEMETPTGSHLPKRVCRYESDIAAEEEKVRLLEDRMSSKIPRKPDRDTG